MKKVNKDPFSNGAGHMMFECQCCSKCIKYSWYDEKRDRFVNADENNQPNRCAIQRDIITRMACNEPINERTVEICRDFTLHGIPCPYMKTERKKYAKKIKNQIDLKL